MFLHGDLPVVGHKMLNLVRLCGIPKGDEGDVRAIMMSPVHEKVAFTVHNISSKKKKFDRAHFGVHQYGSQKNGTESIIHATRLGLEAHPDWDLFVADAFKAFSLASNDIFMSEVKQYYPAMHKGLSNKYKEVRSAG